MTADEADRGILPRARETSRLLEHETTREVLRAFYDVYNELGFGFLESVYQEAMLRSLRARGVTVEREVSLTVRFRDEIVGWFRADLIVGGKVIVETKAVTRLADAHVAQLTNYLRATGLRVGIVVNFGQVPEFRRSVWTGARHPRASARSAASATTASDSGDSGS